MSLGIRDLLTGDDSDHGPTASTAFDVGELAAHLDVPRSTLTYRLRRAEEQLAKGHVAKDHVADGRVSTGSSTSL